MENIQKKVVAVSPYQYKRGVNFKQQPYMAWCRIGGETAKAFYPPFLHSFFYHLGFPMIKHGKKQARLRFVQPYSITFDTFPDYIKYEIIPFIWDCWYSQINDICKWFNRYNVSTAIFTSSQAAGLMREICPKMNILAITEGIETNDYPEGKNLIERGIKLYEPGVGWRCFLKTYYPEDYKRLSLLPIGGLLKERHEYIQTLCNSKITVNFPRSDMSFEKTGGIETLTQRYWETMLTRSVIVGRAPFELIDLIGYNPVIDLDKSDPIGQIEDLLAHIEDYQPLVDKNREVALRMAPWELRMKKVMDWLQDLGYEV